MKIGTSVWQQITIGDIASSIRRPVNLEPNKEYRTMGVRLWGLGVYERETKMGSEIKASKLFAVETNDLIINRIWVQKGSCGIINEHLDGCYVTQDFPTFKIDLKQVLIDWLLYIFKAKWFWEECEARSRGTSGRERIDITEFLNIQIPLPPLDEQRRIMRRIEAIAKRIDEAKRLQRAAIEIRTAFASATSKTVFSRLEEKYGLQPLKGLFKFRQNLLRPSDGYKGQVRFVGLQHIESNTGRKIGEEHLCADELKGRKFRFSQGEIVYGYLRPYLNKVWIADGEGLCSVDQYVLQPDNSRILTEYLAHGMRSPLFLEQSQALTGVLMLPRLRSGLLEQIKIPVPPIDEQRSIVEELENLQVWLVDLGYLQKTGQAELEAVLPAVLEKAFRGEL